MIELSQQELQELINKIKEYMLSPEKSKDLENSLKACQLLENAIKTQNKVINVKIVDENDCLIPLEDIITKIINNYCKNE